MIDFVNATHEQFILISTTPSGALPISGEIEASILEEAVQKFPKAINATVKKLQEDMIRMQKEQASEIVTPRPDLWWKQHYYLAKSHF